MVEQKRFLELALEILDDVPDGLRVYWLRRIISLLLEDVFSDLNGEEE